MTPFIHAKCSVKRYGGVLEDYLAIHELMDKSRHAVPDMRHRVLTHTPFFAEEIIPLVFGSLRKNSEGKDFSPKKVAYDHIEEDFKGWIPPTSDWFINLAFEPWMDNGKACPPGCKQVGRHFRNKE